MVEAFAPARRRHRQGQRLLLLARHLGVATVALGDSLQFLVDQAFELSHLPSQIDHLEMAASQLALELRFQLRGVEILFAQVGDDGIGERIRHRRSRTARLQQLLDLFVARLGLRRIGAREHHLLVELGELLIGNEPRSIAASHNDALGGLEVLHGEVGGERLLLQLRNAILQPSGRPARRFEFGVELIREIRVRESVRDRRRLAAIGRGVVNRQHIGARYAVHVEVRAQLRDRRALQDALLFRIRPLAAHEPAAEVERSA